MSNCCLKFNFQKVDQHAGGKWLILVVSDHYLEYWSLNALHTWYIHWLGESSEMIRFLAKFVKYRPSGDRKMSETSGFQSISETLITQSPSYVVYPQVIRQRLFNFWPR